MARSVSCRPSANRGSAAWMIAIATTLAAGSAGTSASTLTTLMTFNGSNGGSPQGSLAFDTAGNLYGTTFYGGSGGGGTAFVLAAGTRAFTTIANFTRATGAEPFGGLTLDAAGNKYGVTYLGGTNDRGTVFKIDASSGALTTLVNFSDAIGAYPYVVTSDAAGNLYGTTAYGGGGGGTVYKISAGTHALSTLAVFDGINGNTSYSNVVADSAGNLYGTAAYGGANGYGTVFKLAAGTNTLTTLVTFDRANGESPFNGLSIDAAGNLYGTTFRGGANGAGTVFKVAAGTNTLSTLVSFNYTNGASPYAGVIADSAGNLYGTTSSAGPSGYGTVYRVAAGTNTLSTLASFDQSAAKPVGGVIFDAAGNLFGTTSGAETTGYGTVFEISNVADTNWLNATSANNAWATASNWSHHSVAEGIDNAIFNPTGSYTVSITAPASCNTLSVTSGNITFSLAGASLAAGAIAIATTVDTSATVTFSGGATSSANDLRIGFYGGNGVANVVGGTVNAGPTLAVGAYKYDASHVSHGTLTVSGGGTVISGVGIIGESSGVGAVSLTGGSSTWTNSGNLYVGNDSTGSVSTAGTGSLSVANGAALNNAGVLKIYAGGSVALAGGNLSTGSLDAGGVPSRFTWSSGALSITDSDISIGSASTDQLGSNRTISNGSSLYVTDGVAGGATTGKLTLNAGGSLTLASGGIVSVGSLDTGGVPSRLTWTGGALAINDSDVSLGAAATDQLGAARTIASGMSLKVIDGVAGGATTGNLSINSGALLTLSGGELTVGTLNVGNDPSRFNWTAGTLDLENTSVSVTPAGIAAGTQLFSLSTSIPSVKSLNVGSPSSVLKIDGGATFSVAGNVQANNATIGSAAGAGTVTLSSGRLSVLTALNVGVGTTATPDGTTGSLNLINNGFAQVGVPGLAGTGTVTIGARGGIGSLTVGDTTTQSVFNAADLFVGRSTTVGSGDFTVNAGGRALLTGTLHVYPSGSTVPGQTGGRIHLSGGYLSTNVLNLHNDLTRLTWTGGTLAVSGAVTGLANATLNVPASGTFAFGVTAPDFMISATAHTFNGSLDNAGAFELRLNPNDPAPAASLTGSFNNHGLFRVVPGGGQQSVTLGGGGMVVNGSVQLAGTLELDLDQYDSSFYASGPFRLLTATGTISGNFSQLVGREYHTYLYPATLYGAMVVQVSAHAIDLVPAKGGDTTLDGTVDFNDLLLMARHFGQLSNATWEDGDFTGDTVVNFDDLLVLAHNYGTTVSGTLAGDWTLARSLVPEPSVGALSVAMGWLTRRRSRDSGRRLRSAR